MRNGVYKVNIIINSSNYPDAVMFNDVWSLTINGSPTTFNNNFYIISSDNYYTFDLSNQIDIRNYFLRNCSVWYILIEKER